jgi:hypothetical protein
MNTSLRDLASSIVSPVESRLFSEYGAVFLTTAVPPPKIIFADHAEVEQFQSRLAIRGAAFGQIEIELQTTAMDGLLRAAARMKSLGGEITPRAEDAGRRSYEDTVRLWRRNVTRGLDHWVKSGRLQQVRAREVGEMAAVDQVAVILDLEQREALYFGTYFDRSILYSVAAPGASQHLSLLAFDVAEFQDEAVTSTLAEHGWHRTVAHDFPHFTFLGHNEDALAELGLKQIQRDYNSRAYRFWVPDIL